MGWNSCFLFLNDSYGSLIENHPDLLINYIGDYVSLGDSLTYVNGIVGISNTHADTLSLIAVGGNSANVVSQIQADNNVAGIINLLNRAAGKYGYVLKKIN